jgi:hypothetical protein
MYQYARKVKWFPKKRCAASSGFSKLSRFSIRKGEGEASMASH